MRPSRHPARAVLGCHEHMRMEASLCATITPDQVYWHLILIPEATSSTARVFLQTNLLVDNLRSGGTCPPL